MKYIIIDGYFSGTGIRDKYNGGYIPPESLNLSLTLMDQLKKWLTKYELEFLDQYTDSEKINTLDEEGMQIAILVKEECTNINVEYYSDAKMKTFHIK